MGANRADPVRGRPSEAVATTLPINRAQPDNANQRNNAPSAFNTAPAAVRLPADEFGNIQRTLSQGTTTGAAPNPAPALNTPGRRSNSGGANPPAAPTPQQDEVRRTPSATTAKPVVDPYQSAEDEKVQLFVKARERAAKVQGVAATPVNLLTISQFVWETHLFLRLV